MLKISLLFFVLVSLVPLAAAHAQTPDPLVTVTIAEAEVEPGDAITVTWEASSHLRRFHHVNIELSNPAWARSRLTSTNRSGTMSVTIPATYYDKATITVYPQKSDNQYYRDAAGKVIMASAEVVVNDGVDIQSLTISPNPVERGEPVTVAWVVTYGDQPAPRIGLTYPSDGIGYGHTLNLPPVGSMTLTIPEYYTESFFVTLSGEKILGETVETSIICPFSEYYTQAGTCPIAQATYTLTYQYFEKGLLFLWGNAVFVFADPHYAYYRTQSAADLSGIEVPDGLQLPDAVFAGVWMGFRDQLGFATSAADTYSTVLETHPDQATAPDHVNGYWFVGPDDRLIYTNPERFFWTMYDE